MAEEARAATLAPPAVTALREEASASSPHRVHMERTVSQDIREEREDLKEAAEHSLNVIMDLELDGNVRYVTESWKDVIGTLPSDVVGKPVADVLGNGAQFAETIESIKKDDSRSRIIRFAVPMGPLSVLRRKRSRRAENEDADTVPPSPQSTQSEEEQMLNLEAQGIMVYDRTTGVESHVSHYRYSCSYVCVSALINLDNVDDPAVSHTRSHNRSSCRPRGVAGSRCGDVGSLSDQLG
jgi:serine/threonine-protein kinase RIM15